MAAPGALASTAPSSGSAGERSVAVRVWPAPSSVNPSGTVRLSEVVQSPVSVIVVPEVVEAVHTVRTSSVAAAAGDAAHSEGPATAAAPSQRTGSAHRRRGRPADLPECDALIM